MSPVPGSKPNLVFKSRPILHLLALHLLSRFETRGYQYVAHTGLKNQILKDPIWYSNPDVAILDLLALHLLPRVESRGYQYVARTGLKNQILKNPTWYLNPDDSIVDLFDSSSFNPG
jgi:hypothetical protein